MASFAVKQHKEERAEGGGRDKPDSERDHFDMWGSTDGSERADRFHTGVWEVRDHHACWFNLVTEREKREGWWLDQSQFTTSQVYFTISLEKRLLLEHLSTQLWQQVS